MPTFHSFGMADPQGNFYQNPAVGGTPVAFINFIEPKPFEPIIYEHWDFFEHHWAEVLGKRSVLYYVIIVFNAQIYLSGQGIIEPYGSGYIPEFDNFETGEPLRHIKHEIGLVADRLGITPKSLMYNLGDQGVTPNQVYVTNPHFPKPGQRGHGERGGRFSNL